MFSWVPLERPLLLRYVEVHDGQLRRVFVGTMQVFGDRLWGGHRFIDVGVQLRVEVDRPGATVEVAVDECVA